MTIVSAQTKEATRGDAQATKGAVSPASPPTPWEQLRAPFPPEKIGKLPKPTIKFEEWKNLPKGTCDTCHGYHATTATIHLDYIGHGDVTDRLLAVDPYWNWEPLATLENGLPRFVLNEQDKPIGLWIKLTIGGTMLGPDGDPCCGARADVTRLGYGSVSPTAFDPEKQLIGDALRNAAMRFGVGLDLWRKEEVAPAENATTAAPEGTRPVLLPGRAGIPQAATAPSAGNRPLGECAMCVEDGVTAAGGKPSVYWPGRNGRPPQCNGYRDGVYLNHPMPTPHHDDYNLQPAISGVSAAVSAEADRVPIELYDDGSSVAF